MSPKKQQMQICMSKINFEEIEAKVEGLAMGLASINSHNEEQTKEIQDTLAEIRLLNNESERLKREGLNLTAKRLEIKRQCDELDLAVQCEVNINENYKELIKQEEKEIEHQLERYKVLIREKVARYDNTRFYYDNAVMNTKIQEANVSAEAAMKEVATIEACVDNLGEQLENITPNIPEDILNILGKGELIKEYEKLCQEYEELKKTSN